MSSGWLALLSLILAPLYVHLYGIESYGLIGLYAATLLIGGVLDVALSATVSRQISWLQARPSESHRIPSLLRSVEVIYWASVIVFTSIMLLTVHIFGADWMRTSTLEDEQVSGALILMLLSLAIQLPSGLYSASLIGLYHQKQAAILLAVLGTARGLGAVLIAWVFSDDIRVFFIWHIALGSLQLLLLRSCVWSHVRALGGRAFFSLASLTSIKRATGAMFLITVMGVVMSQIDKVVLAFMVPLDLLGQYTLAWGIASGLSVFVMPVLQGFGARFSTLASEGNKEELVNQINLASQATYAMVIPTAITIFLFSEIIMNAWLRDPDIAAASADSLSFLVIGSALVVCSYPLLASMYAKKDFKPVLIAQAVLVTLFFPLLLILSEKMGISGAGLSWLLYGAAFFITYITMMSLKYQSRLSLDLFTAFISVAIASLAVSWTVKYLSKEIVNTNVVLGMALFALVLVWVLSVAICPNLRKKTLMNLKARLL